MKNLAFDIAGLKKIYKNRLVLSVDSLPLARGKVHAIIGPNGSGKTTLLRLLALMDEPTKGSFKIFDTNYAEVMAQKLKWQRRMAMVMQKTVLFNQSVYKNVAYGLKVRGLGHSEIRQRVEETIDWVGMAGQTRQNALTLSGGEAQRVALARAITFQPDILFLDEPTASLDPANVLVIENLIQRINQQFGTTIIIVTHNLFQARRLAHNTIVLMDGQIVEMGDTNKIFAAAKEERTYSFLAGEMIY